MTKRASLDDLNELHAAVCQYLAKAFKAGEVSAALAGVAVKFLKDNSVSSPIEDNDDLKELDKQLRARRAAAGQSATAPVTDQELGEALENFSVH